MSITEAPTAAAAAPGRLVDPRFAKRLVLINGAVPAALLAWDAAHHQLGANEVNFAIRTTGMVGLVLLVLSLLVTPLRRLTGWNQLIAIRRNLGVLGFSYLVMHFTIFWIFDREGSVTSTLHEIVMREYLWFGTAALLLLIPLAATSAGVVHYYLLVKSDVRQPFAFAVVVGGLPAYRVVRHYLDLRGEVRTARARLAGARALTPQRRRKFWSGELEVARIFGETRDVKTFRLVAPGGGPLPFDHLAGQYLNLALVIDGARVNRSYTIASSPTRADYCEITVKRAAEGRGSRHLHDAVREGSVLRVSAPAGRFVFCWPGEIYLLFSIRTLADFIFREELAHLEARFPNLHVRVTLTGDPETPWDGPRGQISRAMIDSFVPDLGRGPILLCGPDAMMAAMRRLFVDELGVPDAEVLQEAFVSPPSTVSDDESGSVVAAPLDLTDAPAAASVRFQRTGKLAELTAALTVLEAAEDAGVAIPFECRSGICGQCKTRIISGTVAMAVQDALTPADRSNRVILACQARAVGDIVIDA
ncbi:MAG: 2Fe-2S iron-sulfur cluster binding domain-containing protein [Deltaproteobacteria bacterium]|nr:MAG: 2Fe-2S iron-sulfur cluster binding domain-containing protein [Deltaproteobacteria bacterium]